MESTSNFGDHCIKYLFCIFNFIFTFHGLLSFYEASISRSFMGNQINGLSSGVGQQLLFRDYNMLSSLSMTISTIITVVGLIGCCGALLENRCLLRTYALILFIILLIQISISLAAVIHLKDIKEEFKIYYQKHFLEYRNDKGIRKVINHFQSQLKCCGVNGPIDYNDHLRPGFSGFIPWSCFPQRENESLGPYSSGCPKKIIEFVTSEKNWLGGLGLGLLSIEIFGIIMTIQLANSISDSKLSEDKLLLLP